MLEHIKTKNFEKAVLEQQKANENLFNCAKAGKSSKTEVSCSSTLIEFNVSVIMAIDSFIPT